MYQIRCTNKLIKAIGLDASELNSPREADTRLGHWYASLLYLDRRKSLIFMNERTLLSYVLTGAKKQNLKDLPGMLCRGLSQLLQFEGFSNAQVQIALSGMDVVQLTKTTSKKVLGNLNDLVANYRQAVYYDWGLTHCDLTEIICRINDMPQRNLGWSSSIKVTREPLANNEFAA